MRLTWLGQAGFRIEIDGVCCVVDPWASPHELRLTPPPPWAVVAEGIDWVLVTHEHLDHLDPPVLRLALERSPTARLVLPGAIASLVEGIVGNKDAAEAVELAVAIGASTLVPYHCDGFAGNTVAPGATADLAAGRLHVVVPSRFGAIELP